MTIQQTIKTIKALPGMTAVYTEFKEFRVRLVGKPEADYFTDNREDALATAIEMSKHSTNRFDR